MKLALALLVSSLSTACLAQWPATPQPQPPKTSPPSVNKFTNDYGPGFSFDNQLYALQGGGIAMIVGTMTYRPWLGLASGVGSCALYRVIHIQGYHNDKFFGSNRMEFCAAGALASYGLTKLMHVHREKK